MIICQLKGRMIYLVFMALLGFAEIDI